jgi:hypothetical protein
MKKVWLPRVSVRVPPETLAWLLEAGNPSVRFFALRDLLGRPSSAADVGTARSVIMSRGPVPRILDKQKPGGFWGKPEDFYARAKYHGTVWTLILLATLGADGSDPRVRAACEFILRYSQDRRGGGFSYVGTAQNGGVPSGVIPCLTGNMVWCLVRFGFLDDPRVRHAIDWIVESLRFDDGETRPPREAPYLRYDMCWGTHTCLDAVVKSLKALAEIPAGRRSRSIRRVMAEAQEFMLRHHLIRRSHDLGRVAKAKWLKLGFPWMWDTDVLEMLDLLTGLGCRDSRLRDGLDLLLSKADDRFRWKLEQTLPGRMQVALEPKGRPGKGVTLKALTVLKRLGGGTSGSRC